MPAFAPWQWLAGAFCAFLVGVAKTGMPGLGILIIPVMVLLVGDTRESVGWVLPILCTADVFAIYYWRRQAAVGRLFSLAPWTLIGMVGGAFALALQERILRPMVGSIIFAMLGVYLWRRFRQDAIAAHTVPYGIAAGFATTVANAAGPVMSLYLLSKKLPKEEFVATGAWFFFIINLTKVPIYLYHGSIGSKSLIFDALMIPAVLGGALTGKWVIHRIPPKVFEAMVIALTVISTVLLFR